MLWYCQFIQIYFWFITAMTIMIYCNVLHNVPCKFILRQTKFEYKKYSVTMNLNEKAKNMGKQKKWNLSLFRNLFTIRETTLMLGTCLYKSCGNLLQRHKCVWLYWLHPLWVLRTYRLSFDMPSLDMLCDLAYVKNVSTTDFFMVELDFKSWTMDLFDIKLRLGVSRKHCVRDKLTVLNVYIFRILTEQ